MAVGDAYVFSGFLTPVLTQLFFPKPPTTFLTCFCRGERRKYAGKKSRLNQGSNSQPPGHEPDTLTTEPPGQGFPQCFPTYQGENLEKYLNFLSANAINLDQSKIFPFGKGFTNTHCINSTKQNNLSLFQIETNCRPHFNPLPNDKF